ncbi:protein Mis18-beta [Chanos chanos]|uniref:Protein Mis18-beta n=1 Tax=Chanos chanos TaxID=29144 RepID=A0A6J2V8Y8_CHACN|nr:protein Mis18-beta [Chanos chanos]
MPRRKRRDVENTFISSNDSMSTTIVERLSAVEEPERYTFDYKNCSVFHCKKCNTVLGDSLGVCGEDKFLDSIICLKVTEDVIVKDKVEFNSEGHLAYCSYNALHCSGCRRFVGVVLNSTPAHLSALRKLFLLQKKQINCYMFKNGTMVKASMVSFEHKPMGKRFIELRRELEAQLKQIECLKEMVGGQTSKQQRQEQNLT